MATLIKWTNMLIVVAILSAIVLIFTDAQKGKKKNLPPPPNCAIPLNSPQFAVLCEITGALPPPFQGLTADQVCKQDCKCVMGARAGGKCSIANVNNKNQTVCKCDYTGPAQPNISCTGASLVTNLCSNKTGVVGKFLNTTCNADCICSHGNANNGQHKCTTKNNVAKNKVTYCVCNNAINIK